MAATLDNIRSADWQLSINASDSLVQGIDEVKQCIDIILLTEVGSDPLRPEFGCDILRHLDKPSNQAVPNIMREITISVARWEPRVELVKITPIIDTTDPGRFKFQIEWKSALAEGSNIVIYG